MVIIISIKDDVQGPLEALSSPLQGLRSPPSLDLQALALQPGPLGPAFGPKRTRSSVTEGSQAKAIRQAQAEAAAERPALAKTASGRRAAGASRAGEAKGIRKCEDRRLRFPVGRK